MNAGPDVVPFALELDDPDESVDGVRHPEKVVQSRRQSAHKTKHAIARCLDDAEAAVLMPMRCMLVSLRIGVVRQLYSEGMRYFVSI